MFRIQFSRGQEIEVFQSQSAREAMQAVRCAFGAWTPRIFYNDVKITIRQLLEASRAERPVASH